MRDSDFSAILELIPQISYEIIGRIIPGIICQLSLAAAIFGPVETAAFIRRNLMDPDTAGNGWIVVFLLLAAYVLALLLDGVWQAKGYLESRDEKEPTTYDRKNVELEAARFDTTTHTLEYMSDVLMTEMPRAASWITKLYAETNAIQVIVVGWAISAVLNPLLHYDDYGSRASAAFLLEVFLLLGISALLMARLSITKTRETSLRNLWKYLQNRTDRLPQAHRQGTSVDGPE